MDSEIHRQSWNMKTTKNTRPDSRFTEPRKNVEELVKPPIPENEAYDDDESDKGTEKPIPIGPGLVYDEKLNKYMDGMKLIIDPTKSTSMHISLVDDQGYLHMTPAYKKEENPLEDLKKKMAMLFTGSSFVKEANKLCNFENLIEGEVVVAKIVKEFKKCSEADFIRARIISIDVQENGATVVDVDTMNEYFVTSESLFRACETVMSIPFQAIKCTLNGLDFFEGSDVIKKLAENCHCVKHPPCWGFDCTIDNVNKVVPEVNIKKYGHATWRCADDILMNLGSIMGAKYRLRSGMHEAKICRLDRNGNVWIHYHEDEFVRDKLKSELTEAVQIFDTTKETPGTILAVQVGRKYIAKIEQHNCSRVIVQQIDLEGYYVKRVKDTAVPKRQPQRILVECMDTGVTFWVDEGHIVVIEKFPSLVQHIPAMCQKVRLAGVKAFSEDAINHQFDSTKFSVKVVSEWRDETFPVEVKMFCQESENSLDKIDLTQLLARYKGVTLFTNKENEEWSRRRNEAYARKENKNQKGCKIDEEDLRRMPPFMAEKFRLEKMKKSEKLKKPFNRTFSGLSGTTWVALPPV